MLAATTLSALGNGLVLPFLLIYLTQVRDIPAWVGGIATGWTAAAGFALTPLMGRLVDRYGPGLLLRTLPFIMALGVVSWVWVREPWQAFIPATIMAVGGAGLWGAGATLLARLAGHELRQRAFGLNFMLLNLGIGIGGLIAGLVVDVERPGTFEWLYRLDALTFVLFGLIMITLRSVGGPVVEHDETSDDQGRFREVFRDRALVRVGAASVLLLVCAYGSIEVGFPLFVTQVADLSAKYVAYGYVLNTAAIVAGQLLVLRLIAGRSRSRLIGLVGVVWAVAWGLLAASGVAPTSWAVVLVLLSPTVFAIGETLWQPIVPSLINDLAPERLRGRYNAFGSLTWNVGGSVGPAFTGVLLGLDLVGLWVAIVCAGSLVGGYLGLRLRSVLTAEQDGRVPSTVVGLPTREAEPEVPH